MGLSGGRRAGQTRELPWKRWRMLGVLEGTGEHVFKYTWLEGMIAWLPWLGWSAARVKTT